MAIKLFKIGNDLSMEHLTQRPFDRSAKPKALTNSTPKRAGCRASQFEKDFSALPHN
jgi:hypothetical protein